MKQSNLILKEGGPAIQVEGKVVKSFESKANRSARPELNLIGQNVEEATIELEQYLDSVVMIGAKAGNHYPREGNRHAEKSSSQCSQRKRHVKGFRLGAFGEGESGVTVVELK